MVVTPLGIWIPLVISLALIGTIVFFGFFRNRSIDQTSAAEITGRTILIGTFSITGFMLLEAFFRGNVYALPEMSNGILTFNALAVAIYVIVQLMASADASRDSRLRLTQAQQKASDNPNSIGYVWNLAAATLENYLERNVSQVKWIFNVAVLAMIGGFAIIGYGVSLALAGNKASVATSVSGVLTQFISVTFMIIYRSTMVQANSYVIILERLNNVGMAVQLLNEMPDEKGDEKELRRTEVLHFLLTPTSHVNAAAKLKTNKADQEGI